MDSVLSFYHDDTSSNPSVVYSFIPYRYYLKTNENEQKEAVLPIYKKIAYYNNQPLILTFSNSLAFRLS